METRTITMPKHKMDKPEADPPKKDRPRKSALDAHNAADIGSLIKIFESYEKGGVLYGSQYAQEVIKDMGGKNHEDAYLFIRGLKANRYTQRGFLRKYISIYARWQLKIKQDAVSDLWTGARFNGEAWEQAQRRFREDHAGQGPYLEVDHVTEPLEKRIGKEPGNRGRAAPQPIYQIGAVNIASSDSSYQGSVTDDSDNESNIREVSSSDISNESYPETPSPPPSSDDDLECNCSVQIQAVEGSIPVQSRGPVRVSYVRKLRK